MPSLPLLIPTLVLLVSCSAFFSASETSMMSLNRYRLQHLAKTSRNARRVSRLLERPDRLLGVILLGNTFANIFASAVGTLIAVHFLGEVGALIASICITILLLIFAEVFPKTLAALYPEKIALPVSGVLQCLLWIFYPLVWIVNAFSNGLLRLTGFSHLYRKTQDMSHEELRTVVHEASGHISSRHRKMLLSILDLEKITVDDIMVPRTEVVGIDLDNTWEAIIGQLANTQHTFLPVYQQDLNNLIGVIHAKKILHLMADKHFDEPQLRDALDKAFFVPQGTSLTRQLFQFQKNKQRFALVVDEYGDILGVLTLEDILEEIVGEFTTDMASNYTAIVLQSDGSYLTEGSTSVREFNRTATWGFPIDGPKTINGLVIEKLEMIPEIGTCCLINDIPIEVVQVQDNRIKTVKIFPPLHSFSTNPEGRHESPKSKHEHPIG